jgi:hypothetical protein
MPSSSPHVNMSFFSYDGKKTISAADAGQRTLMDWNRHIEADQIGRYFINGIKLSELRATMLKEGKCQQMVFADLSELKQFFQEYLFKDLSGERAELATTAISIATRLKKITDVPVLVGVGVSNAQQAQQACVVADGVIQGASVVRRLLADGPDAVGSYVAEVRLALDSQSLSTR